MGSHAHGADGGLGGGGGTSPSSGRTGGGTSGSTEVNGDSITLASIDPINIEGAPPPDEEPIDGGGGRECTPTLAMVIEELRAEGYDKTGADCERIRGRGCHDDTKQDKTKSWFEKPRGEGPCIQRTTTRYRTCARHQSCLR